MSTSTTASYDSTDISYKKVILIFFAVQFICWSLLEFLEHKMGMQPTIRRSSSFSRMAHQNTSNTADRKIYAKTQKGLTRTLDYKGRFRIETRGSIYLIKTLWQLTGFIYYIMEFIIDRQWFLDHFYYLNKNTIFAPKMQNICVLIIAYYCWEMSTNRYAKLQKTIATHHWLLCIAAMTIIYFHRFLPLISWYAFIGLFSAGIPINISLCIRACCKKYKTMHKYIQYSLQFAGYWHLSHLVILFLGSCVIVTNQYMSGYFDNNPLHIAEVTGTVFLMLVFLCNDIITLRVLFKLSHQNYSILSQHQHKKNKLPTSGSNKKSKTTENTENTTNATSGDMITDPDSKYFYEAYPISCIINDNDNILPSKLFDATITDLGHFPADTELTKIPTDFSQYRTDTDDYAKKLYLDGVVNTDRNVTASWGFTPNSMQQFSTASRLSNDSVQFVPVSLKSPKMGYNVTETPYSGTPQPLELTDDTNTNDTIDAVNIKIVNSPINIPHIDTNTVSTTKKTPSSIKTPIPTSKSKTPAIPQLNGNNYSDEQLEQIYDDILKSSVIPDDTKKTVNMKPNISSIKEYDADLELIPNSELFTLQSDRSINVAELGAIKNTANPTPKLQVIPRENGEKRKNINWKEVETRAKSQSFNEGKPNKLKLKSPQNPKHLSVNMVGLTKLHHALSEHKADITVKKEILPSQIKEIENNLPKNCEFGVFEIMDRKSGIQQRVVLVKYLKHKTVEIKDDDDDNDDDSKQTKFIKKLIWTINDIFSPAARIDDAICLEIEDDYYYHDQAMYND